MKVTYSDYLLSRRFNRKLYDKIKSSIEQLPHKAQVEFNMSAKYQTPYVIVTGSQNGIAADEVYTILNEYFQTCEPYFKDENRTDIEFQDT